MLRWTVLFLIIAVIAGIFGFTGIAGTATDIARTLFFILLVLLDLLFGNIAIAIIILTVGLRALLTPLYRRQIVSSRRMQMLSPELLDNRGATRPAIAEELHPRLALD